MCRVGFRSFLEVDGDVAISGHDFCGIGDRSGEISSCYPFLFKITGVYSLMQLVSVKEDEIAWWNRREKGRMRVP